MPYTGKRARAGAFMYSRRTGRRYVRRRIGGGLYRKAATASLARYAGRATMRFAPRAAALYYGYRGAKSMLRTARKRIGEPVGTGGSKRIVVSQSDPNTNNTRTLVTHALLDIPQGTDIDERERRLANVRGFKICMEVKNLENEPLYFNIAVLNLKSGAGSSSGQINNIDFFRASEGPSRARDFANDLNGMEFHCLPINTDRYNILRHKRYRLVPPVGGTTVSHSGFSYMNVDWYIPLKRQIRWDAATATSPESGECWVVYWADKFSALAGSTPVTNAFSVTHRMVTYFREPKN